MPRAVQSIEARRLDFKADVTDRPQSTISLLAQQFFSGI